MAEHKTQATPGRMVDPQSTFPCTVHEWQSLCDHYDAACAARDVLRDALERVVARGHRRCAALTGDESKPCDCGVEQARAALRAANGEES